MASHTQLLSGNSVLDNDTHASCRTHNHLLGSGKIDFVGVSKLVREGSASPAEIVAA